VIGRVEDAALGELIAVARLEELVVRAARDDAAVEARDRAIVDRASERAGREHVARFLHDLLGRRDVRADLASDALDLADLDVGQREPRAAFREVPRELRADAADTLDRDRPAERIGRAEHLVEARADAVVDAERSRRSGIAAGAALAREPRHVLRL